MNRVVVTNKRRTSTYLDEAKYNRIKKQADEAGISVSTWIQNAIDLKLDLASETVIINFAPETFGELKRVAEGEFRSIEDQIRHIISVALQD